MVGLVLLVLAQEPEGMLPAKEGESDVVTHAEGVPQEQPATSASSVVVYGVARCDAVFETARTNYPYAPSFALNPNDDDESAGFLVTPQDSRLGLIWRSEVDPSFTGQLECDVRGPYFLQERTWLRLRRGFFQYRGDKWAVRAGQDWDVFGARTPETLNYEYFRMAGNIGYRRPIVRFDLAAGEGMRLSCAAAAPVGEMDFMTPPWYDTGIDAAMPDIQASFTQRVGALEWSASGVAGARKDTVADKDYSLWGICGNVRLDLGKTGVVERPWIIAAELWLGSNLSSYMGGVGQGVYADDEVPAFGGWLSAQIPLIEGAVVRAGYGIDDPNEKELPDGYLPVGLNQVIWFGVYWTPTKAVEFGAELNLFFTDYLDDPGTRSVDESARAQAASIRIVGAARF